MVVTCIQKKRILFFAEPVTMCHVVRPLVLARHIASQGYEAHFATTSENFRFDSDDQLVKHPLNSIGSSLFLKRIDTGSPVFTHEELEQYVLSDLELIERVKPDLIVGDFRLSLSVSARVSKVPYATITNAYWSPFRKVRYPVPDIPLVKYLGVRAASRLFRLAVPIAFWLHSRPLNSVRKKYGLGALRGDLKSAYTDADFVLYADVPELVKLEKLPTSHCYLGPICWSHPTSLPSWWDEVPEHNPIIHICFGSSGKPGLLETVVNALKDKPVTLIVASCGHSLPQNLPRNVLAAPYLPSKEAMERADVVMCHGGSAPVHCALHAGKPVVGVPSNLDQHLTMQDVERVKVGLTVRSDQCDGRKTSDAIEQILTTKEYHSNAKAFSQIFQKHDAAVAFETFCRTELTDVHK